MQTLKTNKQSGFTLVELMVALALSLVVVGASVSALLVSRQGFTSVDAASQLRDNARFATDFITQLAVQSGFRDVAFVDTASARLFTSAGLTADPDPPIFGYNNAKIGSDKTDPLGTTTTNGSRSSCAGSEGTACDNGSDILVMRYQAGALNTSSALGSTEVDKAMFNCAGATEGMTPKSSSDVIESLLYVDISPTTNEPTLMCKYRTGSGISWVVAPTPLVSGVESFQVLYGTDGVVPGTSPVPAAAIGTEPNLPPISGQPDSIPERYLRANQLTVPGNIPATNENWRRVRSLRVGLILRGAPGSAQDRGTIKPLYPLGSAFSTPLDAKSSFLPIPSRGDGRLRQVVTFSVYLHNYQGI